MRVYRTHQCGREIQRLQKKYRSSESALEYHENLLRSDFPVKAVPISGLQLRRGNMPLAAFKTKIPLPELGGTSSGLRFVYEEL